MTSVCKAYLVSHLINLVDAELKFRVGTCRTGIHISNAISCHKWVTFKTILSVNDPTKYIYNTMDIGS